MITKARLKEIKSLQLKKNRVQHQRFLVEGAKTVLEVVNSDYKVEALLCTSEFITANAEMIEKLEVEVFEVSVTQLESVSSFKSNTQVLAVVHSAPNQVLQVEGDEYAIVLDDVRDPGNLGTIIRIADWYGIEKIICSATTAELYNPKVISATKGSFTRVKLYYTDLPDFFTTYKGAVYGTYMDGDNVHAVDFEKGGLLVMGNEANGIGAATQPFINQKITIPNYGQAESLNVAIATAIVCDNIKR